MLQRKADAKFSMHCLQWSDSFILWGQSSNIVNIKHLKEMEEASSTGITPSDASFFENPGLVAYMYETFENCFLWTLKIMWMLAKLLFTSKLLGVTLGHLNKTKLKMLVYHDQGQPKTLKYSKRWNFIHFL